MRIGLLRPLTRFLSTTSIRSSMSSFTAPSFAAAPAAISGKPTWQQTMLRISDPASSLSFYREKMYMTLLDQIDFPEYSFSLYFLASLNGEPYDLTPGTDEAHRFLWSFPGVTLELTHNHGPPSTYHAGNEEGDGFGKQQQARSAARNKLRAARNAPRTAQNAPQAAQTRDKQLKTPRQRLKTRHERLKTHCQRPKFTTSGSKLTASGSKRTVSGSKRATNGSKRAVSDVERPNSAPRSQTALTA